MNQTDDNFSFVRTFKYSRKDNDNPFNIKYFGKTIQSAENNVPREIKIKKKQQLKVEFPQISDVFEEKDQHINYSDRSGDAGTRSVKQANTNKKAANNKKKSYKQEQRHAREIQQLKQFSKINFKKQRKQYKKNQQKAEKMMLKNFQKVQEKLLKKEGKKQKYNDNSYKKFENKKLGDQLPTNLNRVRSRSTQPNNKSGKQKSKFPYDNNNNKSREQTQNQKPQHTFKKNEQYDQYIDIEQIEQSRQNNEKKYYRGVIEFNERIKWFAKIKSTEVDGNLVAQGKNRNRCIHQDQAYFQIVEETQLKTYCKIVAIIRKSQDQESEDDDDNERRPSRRQIVGKIDFLESKRLYYIIPINQRFISMNIRMNELKKEWLKQINKKYFLVEFHSWKRNSQYPQCTIIDQYGNFGQVDIQANALLKTHNVYEKQYTEVQIYGGLKKFIDQSDINGEYKISPQEIQKRQDLRNQRIFTIDPLTARDFDDALSITKLSQERIKQLKLKTNHENEQNQIYQIGVHIADASFFCQQGSIIDDQAQKRTTSVYLVHKVLPMLPRILCQTMCSLNPGLERLTLSIWFYIDIEGNILEGSRYNRTVIKSKARFTYEQAQEIIQGKINSQQEIEKGYGCINEEDDKEIFHDIKIMNQIAMKLRNNRIENGSLIFETPKKSFKLNEEFFPISYDIRVRCESNFLVEEYMLLANSKVGEILAKNIKSQALLRRHKFPGEKKIATFQAFMKKIGHPIKITKNTKIQEQINQILSDDTIKLATKQIIKHEMIYLLQMAQYFVIDKVPESQWLHYALNMPVYTHFTSPIRRYPDIIVHRQLISIIQAQKNNEAIKLPDENILKSLVDRCNKNKISAKKVSMGCEKIFLCMYLKDKPVVTQAILVSVEDWGFKISVPKYDCRMVLKTKEIEHMKILKLQKTADQKKYMQVEINQDGVNMKIILKELQEIQIQLGSTDTFPLDYKVNFVFPHPKKIGERLIIK